MAEEDDFLIDIDLTDVDDGTDPIADGPVVCTIHTITKKMKTGGEYPYYEIQLKPLERPGKTLWLNLSTHPKALFNIKLFAKAMGLNLNKPNLLETRGKQIQVTTKIVASQNDQDRKVNEVKPPYAAVR